MSIPLTFKGRWNAVTNVTTLVTNGQAVPNALQDGVGTTGDAYIIFASTVNPTPNGGSISANIYDRDLGSGLKSWIAMAYIYYDGVIWKMTGDAFPSGGPGTVTSVALTMPSAFNTAGSPITTAGTFVVTGAGTDADYITGAGNLSPFPVIGGGVGAYYCNGNTLVQNISAEPYYQFSTIAGTGPSANFTIFGNGVIASFITDFGQPLRTEVPPGIYVFQMYAKQSSSGGNPQIFATVEIYNGSTFSVIATSSLVAIPTSVKTLYAFSATVPTFPLSITDRVVVRFHTFNAVGKNMLIYTEDDNKLIVSTTFSSGIATINNLVAPTQFLVTGTTGVDFNIASSGNTHVFNLPIATSGTTGKLTSTAFNTFNNKQNQIALTTSGTTGPATFINSILNIPNYSTGGGGGGTVTNVTSPNATILVTSGTTTPAIDIDLFHPNLWQSQQSFVIPAQVAQWAPSAPNTGIPPDRAYIGTTGPATSGLQQTSASLVVQGNGWRNTGGVSVPCEWRFINLPAIGAANPTTRLFIVPYVAGAWTGLPGNGAQTFFDHRGNMTLNGIYIGQPFSATSSNTSICIGVSSSNITGAGNTLVGTSAGSSISTGTSNTCVGNQSGPNQGTLATGGDNICVGSRAGSMLQGGAANNIIIQSSVVFNTIGISTGSGNVIIGNYQIPTSGSTVTRTGANQIVIADGAGNLRIVVAQTTGNTIINSNVDNGNDTLQVNGSFQSTGEVHATVLKTANYTAVKTDFTIRVDSTAGNVTITLPVGGITVGQLFNIKKTVAANTVNITSAGNIDGVATQTLTAQYSVLRVQWTGATYDTI